MENDYQFGNTVEYVAKICVLKPESPCILNMENVCNGIFPKMLILEDLHFFCQCLCYVFNLNRNLRLLIYLSRGKYNFLLQNFRFCTINIIKLYEDRKSNPD